MTTPTQRLALLKPSTSDPFSTADIAANWQKIDDSPGTLICTSSTHPTWGDGQIGREIFETDTGLKWYWSGASGGFVRAAANGLLRTTTGGRALAQRTSNFTNGTASYKVVCAVSNVVVPAGQRTLMITVTWPRVTNPNGDSALGIFRTNLDAGTSSTVGLCSWLVSGDNTNPAAGTKGSGGSYVTYESNGLAAGVYNWSLQLYSYAGTSLVSADSVTTSQISIVEI